MNRLLLVVTPIFLGVQPFLAQSSTHVGNGGNVLEAEVNTTTSRIKTILASTSDSELAQFCRCPDPWANRYCDHLSTLTSTEEQVCSRFVEQTKAAILQRIDAVRIQFTDAPLTHTHHHGHARQVQAGADSRTMAITINSGHFEYLSASARVMLLFHELGHLVRYDGEYVNDHSQITAFGPEFGGRKLLDAASAAVTAYGIDHGYVPDTDEIRISNSKREFMIFLGFGSRNHQVASGTGAFSDSAFTTAVSFYYQPSELGLHLEMGQSRYSSSDQDVFTENFHLRYGKIGASYRSRAVRFLFENTKAYLLMSAGIGQATANVGLSDTFVNLSERRSFTAPYMDIQANIGIANDFWAFVKLGITHENWDSGKINLEMNGLVTHATIGGGYGF